MDMVNGSQASFSYLGEYSKPQDPASPRQGPQTHRLLMACLVVLYEVKNTFLGLNVFFVL